jgi:hypothetical protein
MYFEGSTVVLVAGKEKVKQANRGPWNRQLVPIEHIHRAFSIMLCGEDYSTESPRAAILAKSDVCAENGTRLTEKIFKILPLTVKR